MTNRSILSSPQGTDGRASLQAGAWGGSRPGHRAAPLPAGGAPCLQLQPPLRRWASVCPGRISAMLWAAVSSDPVLLPRSSGMSQGITSLLCAVLLPSAGRTSHPHSGGLGWMVPRAGITATNAPGQASRTQQMGWGAVEPGSPGLSPRDNAVQKIPEVQGIFISGLSPTVSHLPEPS